MTESEKLDLILSEMRELRQDVHSIHQEMDEMKQDIRNIHQEMDEMKLDIRNIHQDVDEMKQTMHVLDKKTTGVTMHLENGTDKNIQLIAENFIELTKKLNQAIPAADKNLAYEVKVNYLIEEVAFLKQEIAELKSKIA